MSHGFHVVKYLSKSVFATCTSKEFDQSNLSMGAPSNHKKPWLWDEPLYFQSCKQKEDIVNIDNINRIVGNITTSI